MPAGALQKLHNWLQLWYVEQHPVQPIGHAPKWHLQFLPAPKFHAWLGKLHLSLQDIEDWMSLGVLIPINPAQPEKWQCRRGYMVTPAVLMPYPASSGRVRKKQSRSRDAQTKVIAALTKHYQYAEGGCLITPHRLANQPQTVRWLWPGYIPLGKLTVVAGRPGVGKSLFVLDVASRVSTGSPWPGPQGGYAPQGSVLLLPD